MEKLRLYDFPINRRAFLGIGLGALAMQGCSQPEQQPIEVDDRIILPGHVNMLTREDVLIMFRYGASLDQITRAFNPEGGFSIEGEPKFVKEIKRGLTYMLTVSPTYFAPIAAYLTSIQQGSENWSFGGKSNIQISSGSASHSLTYAGSIVLHEAVHVQNWVVQNFPVFGKVGEAKSLGVQANYLDSVGDKKMADWVRGQIGIWEG